MPYLLDEWQFEIGAKTFVVRSNKIAVKEYGKRVNLITFGVKKGAKNIGTNLTGITDIRQYLATVFSAIEKMHEDPTSKLANKSDGFILSVPTEIFEKHGTILKRIAKLKFKKTFKIHNSYFELSGIDDRKAIYIWKKEKAFNTVFSNLGVSDDSDDALVSGFARPEAAPVRDIIKQMVKTKLVPAGKQIQIDNPVINAQLDSESTQTTAQKIEAAKKAGGIDLNEIEFDLRSYLKIAAYYAFFNTSFYSDDENSQDIKSLDSSTAKFGTADLLNLAKYEMDQKRFSHIIPSETECLLALNLMGIETDHIYDFYNYNLSKGSFADHRLKKLKQIGLSGADEIRKSLKKPRKRVSLEEIANICLDAKKIINKHGYQITSENAIETRKYLSSVIEDNTDSSAPQEKNKMFYTILASADPMMLDSLDHFEYSESSKGTKTVKNKRYEYKEYKAAEIISSLYNYTYELSKDPKEVSKYIDMLPEYAKGMYSEDVEIFEVNFISN